MDLDPRMQELAQRLRGPRPGAAARQRLSPRPHRGRLAAAVPAGARPAAVLMLLVSDDGLWLPLMRRRVVPGDRHSGQISLPGGSFEAGESAVDAALREAQEELGIDPGSTSVLGVLDPQWIPVSGFVVHPVVATARRRTDLVCDPAEVECGFWVDFDALRQRPVRDRPAEIDGRSLTMRGWDLEQGFLWGATAMMLAELIELVPDP